MARSSRPSPSSGSVLPVLVLACLTVLVLGSGIGGAAVRPVRSVIRDVFGPLRGAGAGSWLGPSDDALRAENQRLIEENNELRAKVAAGEASARELDELRNAKGLDGISDIKRVAARVVGQDISNQTDLLEIDRGSTSGIEAGMTVVNRDGLVGRVVEVSGRRCVIRVLTDKSFSVGVRLARSGDVATANGRGRDDPLLQLRWTESDTMIRVGDIAVTAGLSGLRFPPDIPVGEVVKVVARPGGQGQDVEVRPIVRTDRLVVVEVLLWKPAS